MSKKKRTIFIIVIIIVSLLVIIGAAGGLLIHLIPPAPFEPPVRTFRATIPVIGSQIFR